MARVTAVGLAAAPLSRGPAVLEVAPSQGLVTLSVCGSHLVPRVSAGPQRLDQVGLERDTRATVTSCAVLEVVGTLTEARARAGDGIKPLNKCAWPRSSRSKGGETQHIASQRGCLPLRGAWCLGVGWGQPILCKSPLSQESPPCRFLKCK